MSKKKWKVTKTDKCNFCEQEEDYAHYFLKCRYLNKFWQKVYELLKRSKIDFDIKLEHLVFGYKITDSKYYFLNYILTVFSFSIYKSYYVSEQRTKTVDVFSIFENEFNKRIDAYKSRCPMLLLIRKNF